MPMHPPIWMRTITLQTLNVPQIAEDIEVEEPTQRAGKPPVQDGNGKGKKVSKKMDRVSDMTVALKE